MKKMMLASLLALNSAAAFATEATPEAVMPRVTEQRYMQCEEFSLSTRHGLTHVSVNKTNSLLNDETPLETSAILREETHQPSISIAGLRVTAEKVALVDQFEKNNFAWVAYHSSNQVYGVKFHVEADETIGMEIRGDVGFPVKQVTVYTICTDTVSVTRPVR